MFCECNDFNLYSIYWVTFGNRINSIIFVLATVTSAHLIYATGDAFNLILNGVALFFLTEMDNLLIGGQDKKRIRRGIKYIKEYMQLIEEKKISKPIFKISKTFDIINGCFNDFYNISTLFLAPFFIVVVPIWNFICYSDYRSEGVQV